MKLTKLSPKTLIAIYSGLLDLDGLQKPAAAEGSAPVFVPHKYSGKFTLRRVMLLNVVKAKLDEFEQAVESLRKQHKTGDGPGVDKDKAGAFGKALEEMRCTPIDVENVRAFKLADLNLYDPETNPKGNVLAASIIERVLPLIEDEIEPIEKKETPSES